MKSWLRKLRGPAPAEPAPQAAAPVAGQAEQVLRRLEWTVIRRLDGLLQGDYRTLMRGAGLDLADLREYQHHDDVRHIDWNVTARLQQPHVRVFTEDREMAAWFLVDLSPSVDFGSGEQRKRNVSAEFVAVLARMLTRHGNRVGAVLYGSGVDRFIPSRAGRRHVLHILDAIQQRPATQAQGPTRLHDLLQAAAALVRRRSTIFVVSDFISEPGWERALAQLAQRHEVVAVRVLDPMELDIPDLGLLTLRDAETGEQLLVDTHDAGFRRRFARVAAQREAELRAALAQAGVDALELSTGGDLAEAVLRFAEMRRRRSRLSSGAGFPAHLQAAA
ncbi:MULTISPECIES: DUF58 domain-containing protein [Ramlibacter]|uniref:DUF58 domain-containing protein n=1 Tax=Ramlibacter aquaticus TaxID=2780094 RepID=A0ABR9SAB2_9BURK|nr:MULTISPECIES: DUF58 domain-containing protein [Ramlibacter]MBE7939273.1 DUF58 domain-containing protein [Ramlibacter aquaticus]